jgi:hypothetical protein
MSNFTIGDDITRKQGADLTGKLFYIVKQDTTAQQVVLAAAGTDKIFGVLSRLNAAGSTAVGATVNVHARNASGTFKVICGGTVAIGDQLTSDSAGKAVATTTSGDHVLGEACEAGVAGQIIEYLPKTGKV